jgi:hypothetical protein
MAFICALWLMPRVTPARFISGTRGLREAANYTEPVAGPVAAPSQDAAPESSLDFRFGTIVFRENSPFGMITVGKDTPKHPGNKALFINYRDMCHSTQTISESKVAVLNADQLAPGAELLNIGLGCGFTASYAASTVFSEENRGVVNLPKVHVMVRVAALHQRVL